MARRPPKPSHAHEQGHRHAGYRRILGFFILILAAFIITLAIRSFVIAPYRIPSESMEPNLLVGDYVIATKWDYGLRLGGHMFSLGSLPERGDIVMFDSTDGRGHYVKRVIGLPGDRVALSGGDIWLNGNRVERRAIDDFVIPISADMDAEADRNSQYSACLVPDFERIGKSGDRECRFPQFAETLPGGRSYHIIDLIDGLPYDDMPPVEVPRGRLFVMGDNRDRSADSRLPQSNIGAIGLVSVKQLSGQAAFLIFSVDGSAQIGKPGSWLGAVRWNRLFMPVH